MTEATAKRMFKAIEDDDRTALSEILDGYPEALETVGSHNRLVRDKTPLMYAMQCGNLGVANWLLDRGANAAAVMPGGPGSSVLGLCMYFAYCDERGHDQWFALAERLLDAGADATAALWPALCSYGRIVRRTELLELLVARGADLDQPLGDTGDTIRGVVEANRGKFPNDVLVAIGMND